MVGHQFVCKDDLKEVKKTGCIVIHDHDICEEDLVDLFHGEHIPLSNGASIHANFQQVHGSHYGEMCRMHQGVDFCLENIHDLYEQPHDCVMLGGDWKCQDQMFEAWKTGCIEINHHDVCGEDMVDVVL